MTPDPSHNRPNIVLAVTGASGVIYAMRLLQVLLASGARVHLSISPSGALVLRQELNVEVNLDTFDAAALPLLPEAAATQRLPSEIRAALAPPSADAIASTGSGRLEYHHYQNLMASIASGSFLTSGMVICPCSGSTLGAVVHGTGENLIHRAASVHLKERRRLVVVPRETPLSTIQLENMRRAAEAGAVVLPAMPGFYHGVERIGDLVDFVVARICDALGVENALMHRWGST